MWAGLLVGVRNAGSAGLVSDWAAADAARLQRRCLPLMGKGVICWGRERDAEGLTKKNIQETERRTCLGHGRPHWFMSPPTERLLAICVTRLILKQAEYLHFKKFRTAGHRRAVMAGEGRMDTPPPSGPTATDTRPDVDVAAPALGDDRQQRHPFLR